MIPTEALMPGEKGYNAFVIKGGIAKPTPVVISNRTETEAIITSGIKSGDSIVISICFVLAMVLRYKLS